MSRIFRMIIMSAIVALFAASCSKDYSYEGGGGTTNGTGGTSSGTAVYTQVGAPGVCTAPVINGSYVTGTPMNASNTVIILVNVVTPGTYTITTGAVNGINFTGSGTFITTGQQILSLTGSGTPVSSGTYSYIPGSGGGCSFGVTVTSASASTAVGTLNCGSATVAGTYTQGTDLTSSNTISIPVNVTTAGTYNINAVSNGCTFSGSGNLAAGAQTITLTGSGTPTNSGTISVAVSLGSSVCDIPINYAVGTVTDFLKCSIDGGPITNFNNALTGSYSTSDFSVSGQSATQDLQVTVTHTTGGTVGVGTYHNASPTNTVVFCADQLSNLSSTQTWVDLSPTSNIFTVNITTITPTVVTGTFNGNLYDLTGGGGTKVITNGSFRISY